MTSFASLMALSATHTKESQRVVEDALQERRRKEIQRAKQRAERELEEKERERKLLLKRFEDEKRDRERLERLEVERQAKELALQRREEEQRDTLRYGPKKAAKLAGKHSTGHPPNWPSSSASNREAVRKLRVGDDQDDGPSSPALTREEIRERKLQAELRKTYVNARRSTATGGYSKRGKKLPGGALDIKTSSTTIELAAGQTVKERLASLPMTLKVLGGRNKDRRSELEMFYDSKRKRSGQVLEGDEARNFNEYFAPSKKEKEKLKQVQAISTSANTSGADSPGPGPRECFSITISSVRHFLLLKALLDLQPRSKLLLQNLRRHQQAPASNHTRHLLIHAVPASKHSQPPRQLRKPQYPKSTRQTPLHHDPQQRHIVGRNVLVLRVSQSLHRPRGAKWSQTIFHLRYGKCSARTGNNIPPGMSSAMTKTWKPMRPFSREKRRIGQIFLSTACIFTCNSKPDSYFLFKCPHCKERGNVGDSRRRTPRGRKAKTQERKRARSCSCSIRSLF